MRFIHKMLITLAAAATLGSAGDVFAQPSTKSQLVKCVNTNFASGLYGSYFSGSACGGVQFLSGYARP